MEIRKISIYVMAMTALAILLVSCGGGGSAAAPEGTKTYIVTYDGNNNTGGSVPVDTTHYQQGQTVTVLDNTGTLVRTGGTFLGWNTQADGFGTAYAQGQTFTMGSANVILYAAWDCYKDICGYEDVCTDTCVTEYVCRSYWVCN
jgi:hypothetical protein